MSNDYEKLKTLLFKDELADLSAFRQLLNDDDALAEKLSQVLDQASDLALKNNPKFQKKFTSNQPEPYLKALKRDPKGLVALLTPIISPIIRSAVIQTMRNFISEINSTLEQGFSLKYLKWRWRARRTGIPLSEIVFEHTIQYQVQQLFLIDRETGLLVEYAGQEDELIQDKDAMSAMLTAIQDFVSDSLTADTGTLSAAELGDNLLWVFPGTSYNLAAIIKGAPSGRLRTQLADLLSHIHINYSQDFEDQNLWNNHPAAHHDLSEHLVQQKMDEEEKIAIWPWLLALLLLITWFGYNSYQKHHKITSQLAALESLPGVIIDDLRLEGDQFVATGLKDPLVNTASFSNVTFETQSYYALDTPLVKQRAEQYINNPQIKTSLTDGTLTLSGKHNSNKDWHQLALMPGIDQVIDNTQTTVTPSLAERLSLFIEQHPLPDDLELTVQNQKIMASGMILQSKWLPYKSVLDQAFEQINSKKLTQVPSRQDLVDAINKQPILIKSLDLLSEANKNQIQHIIEWDKQITRFYQPGLLTLHSRSDCQGSIEESMENNQRRLSMVHDFLLQSGIKSQQTEPVIEACESLSEQVNLKKIGIWFEKK